MILNGTRIANKIKKQLKQKIQSLSKKPGLGIVLVGDKPDSKIYVNMKKKACEYIGIHTYTARLPENIEQHTLLNTIHDMNNNPDIHGILIQLPLPKHLNENKILDSVDFKKDVDGFHAVNNGKLMRNQTKDAIIPCTPKGIMHLLKEYKISLYRKNVVVIGKSKIVGLPLSLLLLNNNATVTTCHLNTKDHRMYTKHADIVVVATGNAHLINSSDLKKGCVVIDVGINRIYENGQSKIVSKIVGDVDYDDVRPISSAITPVPGGVGPMTIAMVLSNTLECYNIIESKKKI